VLCLLFAFGAILHFAHATPAQAHATAPEVIAVSNSAESCEPGHAAAEHCHPSAGCPLCASIGAAVTFLDRAPGRLPMAAAALVPSAVIIPHFPPAEAHPSRLIGAAHPRRGSPATSPTGPS
jgi:hypothetical protein